MFERRQAVQCGDNRLHHDGLNGKNRMARESRGRQSGPFAGRNKNANGRLLAAGRWQARVSPYFFIRRRGQTATG